MFRAYDSVFRQGSYAQVEGNEAEKCGGNAGNARLYRRYI